MDRVLQSMISGALIIASLGIVFNQWDNLMNLTGNMEDMAMMFIAVAFVGIGVITFIKNENKLFALPKDYVKTTNNAEMKG
jgi:ABC-type dipeptide/oligopeptide/nickel transport system permease component